MMRLFRSMICYGVWLGGLALFTVHLSGYAQSIPSLSQFQGGMGENLDKLLGGKTTAATPMGELVFEGAIDPDEYIVGPGDLLNIVFWQPTYQENSCTVSGDGTVVIPMVGVTPVAGLTLTQARARLDSAVASALRWGRITVSLVEPRRFRVHVTGLVERPGTYVLPATARVADAILEAGGLKRENKFASRDTTAKIVASLRRIELFNPDGTAAGYADLLLFQRGGRMKANPWLRDGEIIHVRAPAQPIAQIGVFGEVCDGGLFDFVEGDCVADVIALAGGLTHIADSNSVSIVSVNGSRKSVVLDAQGITEPLRPGDRVYVLGTPDTSKAGSMVIKGEVARPGGYPVISGETTLREVLLSAGGLLPTAAPNSARLIRHLPNDLVEPERMRVMAASLSTNTLPAYKTDPELAAAFERWDYGTVVVDLTKAADAESESGGLRLQDGDVLEIPSVPLGVRVLGGVNNAGEVRWESGQNLAFYLKQAGGVNKLGWKSRAVVVKARNGSQIQYQSSLPIDPGDVIFIPAKQQMTTWDKVKDFVAVTAQVVTIALVIQNVGN